MCPAGRKERSRPVPSQEPLPQPSLPTPRNWGGDPQESESPLMYLINSEIQRMTTWTLRLGGTWRKRGRTEGSREKTDAHRPGERASSPVRLKLPTCNECGVGPGPPHHRGTVRIPGWVGGKAFRRGSPSLIQNGIGQFSSMPTNRAALCNDANINAMSALATQPRLMAQPPCAQTTKPCAA